MSNGDRLSRVPLSLQQPNVHMVAMPMGRLTYDRYVGAIHRIRECYGLATEAAAIELAVGLFAASIPAKPGP